MTGLSDEMKMAVQFGMRAGVEMTVAGLEAAKNDPRAGKKVPIREALQVAIDLINKMAAEKWPEGKS